jgi:hypothetical protein
MGAWLPGNTKYPFVQAIPYMVGNCSGTAFIVTYRVLRGLIK